MSQTAVAHSIPARARLGEVLVERGPLRPADKCSLCFPGAGSPANCGLVYLMRDDPELQELYAEERRRAREGRIGA